MTIAKANFVNTSAGMVAQIAGTILEILSGNFTAAFLNAYGITGVGAYGQSADNVIHLDEKLNDQMAKDAQRYEYIQKIETERLEENFWEQHPEIEQIYKNKKSSNQDMDLE